MATYTLIPSTLKNYASVTSESNAFTDTNSNTKATAQVDSYDTYLGGFDFSVIPSGETVVSITIKAKFGALYPSDITSYVVSKPSSSSSVLSSVAKCPSSSSTVTFALTSSVNTIMQSASTLCIAFHNASSESSVYIYGAEIIVETGAAQVNKVIYDGDTLIDLTSDTATASDVLSGKTFHLANGFQATGEYVPPIPSANKKTAKASSSTTSLAFTGLTKAPSFFVALPSSSIDTTYAGSRTICVLYDGETTYRIYARYTNGSTRVSFKASSASFTYSSGTLTVNVSGSIYLLEGDWNLFYI